MKKAVTALAVSIAVITIIAVSLAVHCVRKGIDALSIGAFGAVMLGYAFAYLGYLDKREEYSC